MEWINVKDRIPDAMDEYLVVFVCGQTRKVMPAWWEDGHRGDDEGFRWEGNDCRITHWMSFPEPPKETE